MEVVSESPTPTRIIGTYYLSDHKMDANTTEYLIKTTSLPNQDFTSLYAEVKSSNDGHIELLEDVVVTDVGTEIPLQNANRNSNTPPLTKIYLNPIYSGGLSILKGMIAGQKKEGEISLPPGLILKNDCNYIIKVIIPSGTDFTLALTLTM